MSADPQQDSECEAHSDEIKRALIKLRSDCEECSLLRGGVHERLRYLRLYYCDADEVDELLKADSLWCYHQERTIVVEAYSLQEISSS
jgi:hypothetical protein